MADDASTDGTAEWLARCHPEVRVVRLERNQGFCAAANAGIAAARGRFIQLLNNDTEVGRRLDRGGPGPVRRSDRGVGRPAGPGSLRPGSRGFGRRLLHPGRLADQARPRPKGGALCRAAGRRGLRRQRIECLLSGRALRRTGGFDPLLGSYYEDIDLAFRLRWAGYRCLFSPGVPDSSRRLGDLRPQEPCAPAPHGQERRDRLLGEPAASPAREGAASSPRVSGIPGSVAPGARPAAAVPPGQMRRHPRLAGNQSDDAGAAPSWSHEPGRRPTSPWAPASSHAVRNHLRRPRERSGRSSFR